MVSTNLDIVLRDTPSRVQLREATFDIVRIDGREVLGGNPSCLYARSLWTLPDFLKANPVFYAEFLVKTRSSKLYRRQVAGLKKEFIKNGFPLERIKFVYGGREKEIDGEGGESASFAISLVSIRK